MNLYRGFYTEDPIQRILYRGSYIEDSIVRILYRGSYFFLFNVVNWLMIFENVKLEHLFHFMMTYFCVVESMTCWPNKA